MPTPKPSRVTRAMQAHPWKSAVAIVGAMGTIVTAGVATEAYMDRYQLKRDAEAHERADDARNAQQDKESLIRGLWSQFGTTQLRAQFMEDQVYNLAAKKQTQGVKFTVSDEVSLQRYTKQLEQATARLVELRKLIDGAK